jgi:Domain of unknown function (DUF4389)
MTVPQTTVDRPIYPVHVEGSLDPHLKRWVWLVKWLLAIPHFIVLAFLWLAFGVLSVIAFFGILFTGRYPRAIFDFNVGVLRWTWRVGYYAYGALGTDRYPPFTLADVPDYPAHLEVDYPEHLSRGLVLVKWWLLAIPHYIVVTIFLSGTVWVVGQSDVARVETPGLIGVLVFFAAVVLLFTGRYPQTLFDLVLGLNRWVLRVAAYVALMTDRYPPFRLDLGPDEPGSLAMGAGATSPPDAPATPSTPTPSPAEAPRAESAPGPSAAPPRGPGGWTGGRIVAVVIGAVLVFQGVAGLVATAGVAWFDQVSRDDSGYVTSPKQTFETNAYALTTETITIDAIGQDLPGDIVGDVRLRVDGVADAPVFVGIAPKFEVDSYLAGVGVSRVDDLGDNPTYDVTVGGEPAEPPGQQSFWAESSDGTGTQTLLWDPEPGDWTVVVMNASGEAGLAVTADVGATLPALDWLTVVLLIGSLLLLAIGGLIIWLALRAVHADQRR